MTGKQVHRDSGCERAAGEPCCGKHHKIMEGGIMVTGQAFKNLEQGWLAFRERKILLPNIMDEFKASVAGQNPFAIVVTSASSPKVTPRIFGQGIGKIFVVRMDEVDAVGLGSIEYGIRHLKNTEGKPLELLFVLGASVEENNRLISQMRKSKIVSDAIDGKKIELVSSTYASESGLLSAFPAAKSQAAKLHYANAPAFSTEQLIEELKAGNERFVEGKLRNLNVLYEKPMAVVVMCSDSRMTEYVFDLPIGGAAVLQVAGNVVTSSMAKTISQTAKKYGVPVIILGHSKCGAVTAACGKAHVERDETNIIEIAKVLSASVEMGGKDPEVVIPINVKDMVASFSAYEGMKGTPVLGAVYDLTSGKVNFLDSA